MLNKFPPMAKIVSSDEELRQYLPNSFAVVAGEMPLCDKLADHLAIAENWVIDTFTSSKTFNTICGYTLDNPIRVLTARLVVAEAMLRAIPALDLVLTPNGFGVVNTTTIVPASKDRVERLMQSFFDYRDICIEQLLPKLKGASQWLNSEQAVFFRRTLFQDLEVTNAVPGSGTKWQRYLELIPQITDIEFSLAEDYFSHELMEDLRLYLQRDELDESKRFLIKGIRLQVINALRGDPFSANALAALVNHIRKRTEAYPQWVYSDTAKLFAPPVYHNTKKSAGYWF